MGGWFCVGGWCVFEFVGFGLVSFVGFDLLIVVLVLFLLRFAGC